MWPQPWSCSCRPHDPVQAEVLVWKPLCLLRPPTPPLMRVQREMNDINAATECCPKSRNVFAICAHADLSVPPCLDECPKSALLDAPHGRWNIIKCPSGWQNMLKCPFCMLVQGRGHTCGALLLFACPCPRNILSVPLLMRECFLWESHPFWTSFDIALTFESELSRHSVPVFKIVLNKSCLRFIKANVL